MFYTLIPFLPVSSVDNFLQTVWIQIRPDKTLDGDLGLIWVKYVWHTDGISGRNFEKAGFQKKHEIKNISRRQNNPKGKKI